MIPRDAQLGLSLIELLIAMLIAAIVAAMVSPSFADLMGERRVTAGARAYAASLRMAQAGAVARNRLTEVFFTASDPVPATVASATTGMPTQGGWMARVRSASNPGDFIDGYSIARRLRNVQVEASASIVGFTPLGRPISFVAGAPVPLDDAFVARFTDGATGRRMCTYMTTGGAVRICDPSRADGEPTACRPQLALGAC